MWVTVNKSLTSLQTSTVFTLDQSVHELMLLSTLTSEGSFIYYTFIHVSYGPFQTEQDFKNSWADVKYCIMASVKIRSAQKEPREKFCYELALNT